ncbi:MAG: hypothetical protein AABM33_15225 [Pseudomonadota bacterium]
MSDSTHTAGIRITGDASGLISSSKAAGDAQKRLADEFAKTGEQAKKNADESKRFGERLKEEAETAGKSRTEIERYRAGHLQLTGAQKQSAEASLKSVEAHDRQAQSIAFVKGAALTAAAAITAYAVNTAIGVKAAIDQAAALHTMSQSYGISTEALSAYRYQMSLAGIDQEAFALGMKTLSKNISEARGGVGDGAALFRILGRDIESAVKSGASIETLLPLIADKFASFADGPNKAALSLALFGRENQQLISWLNKGSQGFRDAVREAEAFKLIIGPDMARRADDFNANLARMNALFGASKIAIAEEALPALNRWIERLLYAKQLGGGWFGALQIAMNEPASDAFKSNAGKKQSVDADIAALNEQERRLLNASGKTPQLADYFAGEIDTVRSDLRKAQGRRQIYQLQERQEALDRVAGMDTGDQVSRMMARGAAGKSQAPALPKTGADAESDYSRLNRELRTHIELLELQASSGEKVTQGDQIRVQLLQAVADKTVKLNGAQVDDLVAKANNLRALELEQRAREELTKQDLEIFQARNQFIDQQKKSAETMVEENKRQREQTEELGLTTEALGRLRIGRIDDTIAMQERDVIAARAGGDEAYVALLERELVLLRERRDLTSAAAGKTIAVEEAKAAKDAWKSTSDSIERSLTDALMRGFDKGKTFMQNLRDAAVNMFKTLVLEPIIKPIAQYGASTVLGAFGMPGAANAGGAGGIGGLSNLNSLYNMFSGNSGGMFSTSAPSWYTAGLADGSIAAGATEAGAGLYAAGGTALGGAALGGTALAGEAAALGVGSMYGGAAAGGALAGGAAAGLAAVPVVGWIALAAIAAYSLMSDDDKDKRKPSQVQLARDSAGNFFIGQSDVPGGDANQALYGSLRGALNDPKQYDPAVLAGHVDQWVQGAQGESAEEMVKKLMAALADAAQAAQAANQLAAATDQMGQSLRAAQDPLGFWSAQVSKVGTELGSSADTVEEWRAEFLAAMDGTLSAEQFAKWQEFGGVLTQAASAAGAAAQAEQQLADRRAQEEQRRGSLEVQLMQAQGDASGALMQQRHLELAATDESLRQLQYQVYVAQDAAKAEQDLAAQRVAAAQDLAVAERAAQQAADAQIAGLFTRIQETLRFSEMVKRLERDSINLSLSDLSPLTHQQRLDVARSGYEGVLGNARLGDADALGQYNQSQQAYLREAAGFYGTSTPTYGAIFSGSQADQQSLVTGLKSAIAGNFTDSAVQFDSMNLSLTQIDASLKGLDTRLVEGFRAATADQTREIVKALIEQGLAVKEGVFGALEAAVRA